MVYIGGYTGIKEKTVETIIMGYIRYILGLYWDTEKENGNYCNGFCMVYIGVILGYWKTKWKLP